MFLFCLFVFDIRALDKQHLVLVSLINIIMAVDTMDMYTYIIFVFYICLSLHCPILGILHIYCVHTNNLYVLTSENCR